MAMTGYQGEVAQELTVSCAWPLPRCAREKRAQLPPHLGLLVPGTGTPAVPVVGGRGVSPREWEMVSAHTKRAFHNSL